LAPALSLGLGQVQAPAAGRGAEDVSHVHLGLSPGVPWDDVGTVALAIRGDVGNLISNSICAGGINDFHGLMIFLILAGSVAWQQAPRCPAGRGAMPSQPYSRAYPPNPVCQARIDRPGASQRALEFPLQRPAVG
jgi:hypothetical protein